MRLILVCITAICLLNVSGAQTPQTPRFKVLALYENGGHHVEFTKVARVWLNKLAEDSGFAITFIQTPKVINDSFLSQYQVFLQLDYPPYNWGDTAVAAFEKYIQQGRGGWVGLHHASLLGEFDGYPMWQWFSNFLGGIRWKDYIPTFASANVNIEDKTHPVMKGLASPFTIKTEEWYTYDKSPRPNVHVIASVDESSYNPDSKIKMGDHPVVWTNTRFAARNVYIFMGHSPDLFDNDAYKALLNNAIFWAAGQR